MNIIDRLDRRFGRYAIENLTMYLIAGQSIFYVMGYLGKADPSMLALVASDVLAGEWWRLFTFLLLPPAVSPLFVLFTWYLFYMMGTALEEHWGAFRYNLFLAGGALTTVAVAFLAPQLPFGNAYIGGSVFLAFAFLFPDFQFLLFFVLPVAVRWLALLTWIGYLFQFIAGGPSTRLMIVAAVLNFLCFFGRDIVLNLRYGKRQVVKKALQMTERSDLPQRRCTVCGITDRSHPNEDFRFCPACEGQACYCQQHIRDHRHLG